MGKVRMSKLDKYKRAFKDTDSFHWYNANPKDRITGDCAIRALATAFDEPYAKVYRDMFELSVETGFMVNSMDLINRFLKKKRMGKAETTD